MPEEWYQKTTLSLTRVHGCLYVSIEIVNGVKRAGQDWGEAEFWTDEFVGQPSQLYQRDAAIALHHWGRRVKDGEYLEFSGHDLDRKVEAVERLREWRKVS